MSAAVLALVLALAAQEQTPTFRTSTRLVELTVTALDKKGNPVTDLRLQDFTIQENGKPRPIAFFKYDGGFPDEPKALPLPPGVFTNRVEFTPGPPRNIMALVLDELNTPTQFSMRVRAMAARYLKALPPQTRVAVFHMSTRLRILHDFTDDADSLRARIEKAVLAMPLQTETDFARSVIEAEQFVDMFKGDPQMEALMAEMVRSQLEVEMMANAQARRARLERTLASMESLGQHLAGIPGRKNLVWISGGISMLSVTGAMGMGPHGSIESFEDQVKRTSQKLAQQGIVLYIVDATGLHLPMSMTAAAPGAMPVRGRGRFEPQQDAESLSNDTQPAMELMSSTTGGRYLHNTNDLMEGFKKAALDLEGSYTLGFYVSEEPDSKWHNLKASVKRSGVNLRHRKGYLAEAVAATPTLWTNDMAMAVIANPIGSSAVQLTASCAPTADGEAGTLQVNLRIEAGSLRFHTDGQELQAKIQVILAERAPNGSTRLTTDAPTVKIAAQRWEAAEQEGLRYARRWKPAPDAVSLRIVVRDMITGQYGTLDVPLKKLAPASSAIR
jgi:VWFA-related protein